MFDHIQYFGGWMCIIAGIYNLIGSFVTIYIKDKDYRKIDVIYNYISTTAIAWGIASIHFCK